MHTHREQYSDPTAYEDLDVDVKSTHTHTYMHTYMDIYIHTGNNIAILQPMKISMLMLKSTNM